MFAPGIASPARARAGRQWPAVRILFLKKSLPRTGRPGDDSDTSQNETHLRTKRNANAECRRNDKMMEAEHIQHRASSIEHRFLPRSTRHSVRGGPVRRSRLLRRSGCEGWIGVGGFTLLELLIVMGIIGVLLV